MENQNFYEGRILVNMAASVMRQDDLKPLHGNLDWERLFRVADYNKISNLIYLAILGNNEKMPERWKTRFYERYSDILKFNESCTEGEREILVLLELKKIPVLVLSSSSRRQLYPREEMAGESSLKLFFLDPEDYLFAKGYLVNIGYETDTLYPGVGEKMRIPGRFSVEIYDTFPFKTQVYQRGMEKLLQRAFLKENGNYIYEWNAIDQIVVVVLREAQLRPQDHIQPQFVSPGLGGPVAGKIVVDHMVPVVVRVNPGQVLRVEMIRHHQAGKSVPSIAIHHLRRRQMAAFAGLRRVGVGVVEILFHS